MRLPSATRLWRPGDRCTDLEAGRRQLQALDRCRRVAEATMIHKFDDIPANVCLRENIYVLVDEAHRSTGGDLGNFLLGALSRHS